MKITADTNLLVRAVVGDDALQEAAAQRILAQAGLVAIPPSVFCELAWVLNRLYRVSRQDIGAVIAGYLASATVVTDRSSVEAGLDCLAQGGDFADGVIASQGRALGGTHFASFDAAARKRLALLGYEVADPVVPR